MTPKLYKASEVCEVTGLQPYVLRSWEKEFPGIGVQKSLDSPRLYRQADVDQVLRIKQLLYEEGYTIRGAQKLLKGQRRPVHESDNGGAAGETLRHRLGAAPPVGDALELQDAPELPLPRADLVPAVRERLHELRAELAALRKVLRDVIG